MASPKMENSNYNLYGVPYTDICCVECGEDFCDRFDEYGLPVHDACVGGN